MGESNRVFIGNIQPESITEDDLKSYFEKFGETTDVYMPFNQATGQKKNFAFITYTDSSAAQQVIAAGTHTVNSIELAAKAAAPKNDKGKGKGGGKGGGWDSGKGYAGLKIRCIRNPLFHTSTFGPFSAVSTCQIATLASFFNIFRDLSNLQLLFGEKLHSFAPIQIRSFRQHKMLRFAQSAAQSLAAASSSVPSR